MFKAQDGVRWWYNGERSCLPNHRMLVTMKGFVDNIEGTGEVGGAEDR